MTQKEALAILKMGHNVYITGSAGSGKTYLLNQYIKYLKDNGVDIGVTASTGLAATHMGGQTIHAWTGMGIRNELSEMDLEDLESRSYLWKRMESVKVLIIDEVSMLHHFRLDLIDQVLRHFKRNDLPFGGVQVVLCGDFFQLPPVTRFGEPATKFAYESEAWKNLDLQICYLEEQHRQKDQDFICLLNEIRNNEVSEKTYECLMSRKNSKLDVSIEPTRLHTHNADVDVINDGELKKINTPQVEYIAEGIGPEKLVELIKKSCLAPSTLKLRVGAKVIFVKNNMEAGYVNGTLGIVTRCDISGPVVRTIKGDEIKVEQAAWVIEENGKIKASIKQFPLRLAWAITVHKSQGMSLDAVEVDLSRSFEKGMGYVALSRVRSLEGLRLLGINENALQVHDEVLEYDNELRKLSKKAVNDFRKTPDKDVEKIQENFLNSVRASKKEKKKSALDEIRDMVKDRQSIADMAEAREVTKETILGHLEKLIAIDGSANMNYLKKEISAGKYKKILLAFNSLYSENRDYRLAPVKNKLGSAVTFEEIRLVRLFVATQNS
jgi:hypothetical protein